ncbi:MULTISPECIES: hypothetical protein [unclassified Lebetimonas]|uniref:hypothetical protein n=1 Tax=unclassified Lebetimonas TaxID=2648158 RepID=UPI000464426E|nr:MULTISPECIES: hypothetical protein [unclassified Lebetimonas]
MKEIQSNYSENILNEDFHLKINNINKILKNNNLKTINITFEDKLNNMKKTLDNTINLLNSIGIKTQEQRLKELATEYNKKHQEKLKNLINIHTKSIKKLLKNDFSYFLKRYFPNEILEEPKLEINKTKYETVKNTFIKETFKIDKNLTLEEKINFLFNTAKTIYEELENKLQTEKAKNLLNIIYYNLDFMNCINLEDFRITKPKKFFEDLEHNLLNFIDDEKRTYILIEKIIINFLLYYDKFYQIYDFALQIKNIKFNDIVYRCKNEDELKKVFYITKNTPAYNYKKYTLFNNLIYLITNEFNLNFDTFKNFFINLLVKQQKQKIYYAKKQIEIFQPDKNFKEIFKNFDYIKHP